MANSKRFLLVIAWLLLGVASVLAAEVGDEHLVMGIPSQATVDPKNENDYLMRKLEYVLSFNRGTACPNWVCWHLNAKWIGSTSRQDDFRPDPELPSGWLHVLPKDYSGTGFDKGHMCDSKDRSCDAKTNSATFLMTNMVPQSPKNNEHTWEGLESFCRKLAKNHELYIVCGPAGQGGEGKNGASAEIKVNRPGNATSAIAVHGPCHNPSLGNGTNLNFAIAVAEIYKTIEKQQAKEQAIRAEEQAKEQAVRAEEQAVREQVEKHVALCMDSASSEKTVCSCCGQRSFQELPYGGVCDNRRCPTKTIYGTDFNDRRITEEERRIALDNLVEKGLLSRDKIPSREPGSILVTAWKWIPKFIGKCLVFCDPGRPI